MSSDIISSVSANLLTRVVSDISLLVKKNEILIQNRWFHWTIDERFLDFEVFWPRQLIDHLKSLFFGLAKRKKSQGTRNAPEIRKISLFMILSYSFLRRKRYWRYRNRRCKNSYEKVSANGSETALLKLFLEKGSVETAAHNSKNHALKWIN